MTITPEKLRELLSVVMDGKRWFDTGWKQVGDALLEAADELERLQNLSARELCDAYLKKMGDEQVGQWRKEGKLP